MPVEDARFSEDGKTLYCTVTLAEDVLVYSDDPPIVVHEKGTYHVTVDVLTGRGQAEKV